MILLERKDYENARAYVHRVLEYNIIRLELKPGCALSEGELSKMLSVSRTPIREAMIELNRLRLVDILPQRGSYVTKIDYDLIEEARFLRVIIEKSILDLACKGISQDYIELLEQNIFQQKQSLKANDMDLFLELDSYFHELLFRSVNKQWSYRIVKEQSIHFDRLRCLSTRTVPRDVVCRDHEDILYAVCRHDSELAQMLISRHLTRHEDEREELIKKYPEYFVANAREISA